jgi:hypothetical protein
VPRPESPGCPLGWNDAKGLLEIGFPADCSVEGVHACRAAQRISHRQQYCTALISRQVGIAIPSPTQVCLERRKGGS